jgi:galactokinase
VALKAAAFAPGRVNLIGEHTDYNQGLALPFAIGDGVTVSAGRTASEDRDRAIEAFALDLGQRDRIEPGPITAATGWRAFVRGAAAELERTGVRLPGARLEITGTVPRGGGLASSAALEVALCLTLLALADSPPADRLELAKLCSRIEHDWVGAQSGLLDQIAVLFATAGHATLIDFRSLAVSPVGLELAGHRLVTVDSGRARAHTESGYNERRGECERACTALGVSSLRDATLADTRRLPDPLARRVRHVVSENQRVRDAVAALMDGDPASLGPLLNASHASLRDDFEVSSAELERARDRLLADGARGARLIGGGFGGHVLALFGPDTEPPSYARRVSPGPGASLL